MSVGGNQGDRFLCSYMEMKMYTHVTPRFLRNREVYNVSFELSVCSGLQVSQMENTFNFCHLSCFEVGMSGVTSDKGTNLHSSMRSTQRWPETET